VTVLWVFLGGGIGAAARYLTDRAVRAHRHGRFPLGTLIVNLAGALILGAVSGATGLPAWASAALGTGFCGGLTTFSTFMVEGVELAKYGATGMRLAAADVGLAAWYLLISVAGGLLAVEAGRLLVGA
jgi:CrcB protein